MKIQRQSFAHILLLLLSGLALRLPGLYSRPIWYDEAFAILFAQKGLAAMMAGTLARSSTGAADIHPLGYYTLLGMWIQCFGNSVAAARVLSILAGLVSSMILYLLLLDMFDTRTALYGGMISVILPLQIHYAQEIRMYAFLSMWLALATYSFARGSRGGWKWWAMFAAASAMAQYTHNLAVIYLIPLAIISIFNRNNKTITSTFLAGLGAAMLYLPWAIHLPAQLTKVGHAYWVDRPGIERLFTLVLYYLPNLPIQNAFLFPGLFIATLVVVFTTYHGLRSIPWRAAGGARSAWLLYLSFTPAALLWLISQIYPVYIERALLASHLMFCGWIGWVMSHTSLHRTVRVILVGLLILVSVNGIYHHVTYRGFPYYPGRELGDTLSSRMTEGDYLIHSSKLTYLPSLLLSPGLDQGFIIDPPQSDVDTLASATREILQLNEYPDIESAASQHSRIWFVIYQKSIDEYVLQGESTHPHLEYLDRRFQLISVESRDDVRIFFFTDKLSK